MQLQHPALQNYDEGLPIATRLMPGRFRASMLGLFDLARGADNIADNPRIPLEIRRETLIRIRADIASGRIEDLPLFALRHAHDIRAQNISPHYASALLDAFIQDTFVNRYYSISELLAYCSLSTASLGRGFLDIAQQKHAHLDAADALCVALQLLNHWRDIRTDYTDLGRIYLPEDWLREAGVEPQDLAINVSSYGLKTVYQRLDAHISLLLADARFLSGSITHRRVALHARWLLECARTWQKQLREGDPLTRRISPNKREVLFALCRAGFGFNG